MHEMMNRQPNPDRLGMDSDEIEISEDGKFFIVDMKRFDEDDDYAWRVTEELDKSPRGRISDLSNLEYMLSGLTLVDTYHADIRQILSTQTASGFFRKNGKDLNGFQCTHRFSLAVGLASSHWLHKYKNFFGKNPPSWLEQIHPRHVRMVCELSIGREAPLPESLD